MTRDEINELPIQRYQGPIHVVQTEQQARRAVRALRKDKVLGFDTETRPSFRKDQKFKPSLVQLAGSEGVYLFQLCHLPLDDGLLSLMTNPKIRKTGVALDRDIIQLKELVPFEAAGFVDLADIAKQNGIQNHGLRGLTAVLLGFRISKQAQRSNWSKAQLEQKQIEYAATDAWVGRELFYKFNELGFVEA